MGEAPILSGEVGPLGYRRSLAGNNNQAHVEPAGGAVHHLLQQHGHSYHCFHDPCPLDHPPTDHQAAEADEVHDGPAAQDARDTGALRQGPSAGVLGDDEALPGGGCQPCGLPGPAGHPDAHPVRAVPGPDPDGVLAAGPPGGPVGKVLRVDTVLPDLYRCAIGRFFPVDGPL